MEGLAAAGLGATALKAAPLILSAGSALAGNTPAGRIMKLGALGTGLAGMMSGGMGGAGKAVVNPSWEGSLASTLPTLESVSPNFTSTASQYADRMPRLSSLLRGRF